MSGAEAFAVIGVISSILQLVDFSTDVYERAKGFSHDARELPSVFQNIDSILPTVRSSLEQTQKRIEASEFDESQCRQLKEMIARCEATLTELNEIFVKILPPKGASKWTRGWKAILSVKQDKKVENLEKALMINVEALTHFHSSRGLSTAQFTQALSSLTVTAKAEEPIVKKPVTIVPYQKDDEFTFIGREDIMNSISERFGHNPRVAIAGIGGVGKSRIAIEYSYRYHEQHPGSSIFWVHGGSRTRVMADYSKIAERLEILGRDKPNVDILTLVSDWLNDEENGPWLMILDNADDTDVWVQPPDEPLIKCLPRGKHGSILITTRNAQLGKTISLQATKAPINVPLFGTDDSIALLRSRFPEEDAPIDQDSREITRILSHLPLAIIQAAAYLESVGTSVANYLELLKSSEADAVDMLVHESYDDSRDPEIQNAVFHTWKISFDQISRQHPRAASLLSTMALLDRHAIPVALLRDKEERAVDIGKALQTLKAFSLVTEESKDQTFSMHQIVQLSIQWYLKTQNALEKWQEKALDSLDSYLGILPEDQQVIEFLNPHIQLAISYSYNSEVSKLQYARLLFLAGNHEWWIAEYVEAIEQLSECFEIRKSLLGEEHEDTLEAMVDLADVLIVRGGPVNEERAEKLLHQALELTEKSFPKLHAETLRCKADLLYSQDKYQESEALYLQLLKKNNDKDTTQDIFIAEIFHKLTFLYEEVGRLDEAEELQRKAVKMAEERGSSNKKSLASAGYKVQLASILGSQNKHKEELELRREAFSLYNEILGPVHRETLRRMEALASCLAIMGNKEEAEALGREALRLAVDTYGSHSSFTLHSRDHLAEDLQEMDLLDESESLYKENLDLRIKHDRPDDLWTLMTRRKLGIVLTENGKYKEAEEVLRENLRIKRGVDDWLPEFNDHNYKSTINAMATLASELEDHDELQDAERLYREALALLTEDFGEGETDRLQTMSNLATLLVKVDRLDEAETLYTKLLVLGSKAVDIPNRHAVEALSHFAELLTRLDRADEAEALYRTLLKRVKKPQAEVGSSAENRYGGSRDVLRAISSFADFLRDQDRLDEAEDLYREAVNLGRHILNSPAEPNSEHPIDRFSLLRLDKIFAILNMQDLGGVMLDKGNYAEAEAVFREAITISSKALGAYHLCTLRTIRELAISLRKQLRSEEADCLLQDTMKLRSLAKIGGDKLDDDDDDDRACALDMLAQIGRDLKRYKEAEEIYLQSLSIRTRIHGPNHQETLENMLSIGEVHRDLKQYEEAEKALREVLAIRTRVLGPEHRDTVSVMQSIGVIYRDMKKFDSALNIFREILEIRKRTLGPTHEQTIENILGIADCLGEAGNFLEAEEMYKSAVRISSETFGAEHKRTLDAEFALGQLFTDQERHEDAEQIHRKVLKLSIDTVGIRHVDTISTMYRLGVDLRNLKRYQESEKMLRKALFLSSRYLGPSEELTIEIMHGLGKTMFYFKKVGKAKEILERTLELSIAIFGADDELSIQTQGLLEEARAKHQLGDLKQIQREGRRNKRGWRRPKRIYMKKRR
ncbi:TPR-like protein [Stipitochalara longipes BDJ]|nr:TPR-like protein [Stipitochalara longipes BDJ]